jgi:hypothetical protein
MSQPTIPQPTYPGGGSFGTPPAYQQLNTGQILSSAQQQDLTAQQLMLKNFASIYPQVSGAQTAFQSQLGGITNTAEENNWMMPWTMGSEAGLFGEESTGADKLTNMLTGAPGQSGLNIIKNAMGGKYANPALNQTYSTLTGEASGEQPINPLVQQTMMQSGLSSAATNLGGNAFMGGTNETTGTTGQAEVAKNLGLSALNYIQSQQQQGLQGLGQLNSDVITPAQQYLGQLQSEQGQLTNQYQSMGNQIFGQSQNLQTLANQEQMEQGQMFPKTQIGLSGTDLANIMIANTQGQNQFNMSTWEAQMAASQYNSSINAQNAGLQASGTSGLISGGAGIASAAVMVAAFCGVAIRTLGIETRQWLSVRHWIHNHAPKEFRAGYLRLVARGGELRDSTRDHWRSFFARLSERYSGAQLAYSF